VVHALCMVERQQWYMLSAWWRYISGTCSLHGGETVGDMPSAWWRVSSGTCSLYGGETVGDMLTAWWRDMLSAWWRDSREYAYFMVERQKGTRSLHGGETA
jgi:hypothetical protein